MSIVSIVRFIKEEGDFTPFGKGMGNVRAL
jgi:hypothetical protein